MTETDGYTWEEVEAQMEVVLNILNRITPQRSRPRKTKGSAQLSGKLANPPMLPLPGLSASFVLDDVTVPISRIPELLVGIQEISKRHGIVVATFGHAGDGKSSPTNPL